MGKEQVPGKLRGAEGPALPPELGEGREEVTVGLVGTRPGPGSGSLGTNSAESQSGEDQRPGGPCSGWWF